jgi:hypothetical protein
MDSSFASTTRSGAGVESAPPAPVPASPEGMTSCACLLISSMLLPDKLVSMFLPPAIGLCLVFMGNDFFVDDQEAGEQKESRKTKNKSYRKVKARDESRGVEGAVS